MTGWIIRWGLFAPAMSVFRRKAAAPAGDRRGRERLRPDFGVPWIYGHCGFQVTVFMALRGKVAMRRKCSTC